MRAVAVSLVILSHVHLTRGFPDPSVGPRFTAATERLGTIGVDVFFVLSGFLITSLLCRERDRSGVISLRAFYWRRVLRIVPAYVCYLVFVAVLAAAGKATAHGSDWLAALTYTMNFQRNPAWELGHVWSLSIEEHFYVLWPPLFALLAARRGLIGLVVVLVVEPMLRWAFILTSPSFAPVMELWTFTRLDPIAAGCLLALVSRTAPGVQALDGAARFWPLALLAAVAAWVGSILSGKIDVGVAPTLLALALPVLVWAAIRREPRFLETRALIVIGIGSYSLYLWQEVFLNPRRVDWWTAFPQNLVLTALFAAISYRFVERPFLRLKNRRAAV
jgi:peptidoglycan/LPS O-acetylase OafA/YrhL